MGEEWPDRRAERASYGTLRAEEGVMNAHFLGTKRAFHGILRIMRKPLASFGLTAARYDMLRAIFGAIPGADADPDDDCPPLQSELKERLGVHRSVVSRMLRSLEQLGLVERGPVPGDRRQREVRLTMVGIDRLRQAARCLARASTRLLCIAICFGKGGDPVERFRHMCAYEDYLDGIRKHFGDTARLLYPWHPDD
jgi:DNA-binding MarR family transcriptional regulator